MNIVLKAVENIEKQKFIDFLEYCFDISNYFSLSKSTFLLRKESTTPHALFINNLSSFLVKTIHTMHWYSFYRDEKRNWPLEVSLFKADRRAIPAILKYYDNLFFEERKFNRTLDCVSSYLPQDLCFFIGKNLFLGTVSHERICTAYPHSEEIVTQLSKFGEWEAKEIDQYDEEEQICLDKYLRGIYRKRRSGL